MALLRRFLCWQLRTATLVGFIYVLITAASAALLRALDLAAMIHEGFDISRGFNTHWRSHQKTAFIISDVLVLLCHKGIIWFTVFMFCVVTKQHFVLYMNKLRWYNYCLIMYTFIEFCFSVFEFSFYGLNTFRREFLAFIWIYWILRGLLNGVFSLVLWSRCQEMEDEMALEIRHSGKKYVHSYA